ncbi:MAG: hypothetical protein M5U13_05450 [Thermoanaerobaculia bacterium]|nr:hypothetical protein [Thermoanaerobaculia bacterium]
MAGPGAGELAGALLGDQELAAQQRRHLFLRPALLPGEPGGLVLRVVLEQREEEADLEVRVGEFLDLGHPVGDQQRVVRDPLREGGAAGVHRLHRGFEADLAQVVEVLEQGEGGDVARDHLVAHQLRELGHRDLERGVDLVGRLVARAAGGVAGAAEVVHRAGEPGVLDRQELDVGARHLVQPGRQVRQQVLLAEGVELGDERPGERADRAAGDEAVAAPGVRRLGQVARPGGEQRREPLPLRPGRRRRRGLATGGEDGAREGDGLAAAQPLERQLPHQAAGVGEVQEVGGAQRRQGDRVLADLREGARQVDRGEEGVDRLAVGLGRREAALRAHRGGGRVGVRLRQRLVREPGVGDEAARPRGVHHVAAPEGVEAEDGGGDGGVEAVHGFLLSRRACCAWAECSAAGGALV